MDNNKNLWIGLGVVVVLVLLVWWYKASNNDSMSDEGVKTEDVDSTEDTTTGSVNASSPAASISYQNALLKYKDTRIQLTGSCQASPNNVTYKNGTSIMLDNRSNVARTVKLGSTFPIKAYGFKIVKLESSTLPATWLMDCDKSQNVATFLIQK